MWCSCSDNHFLSFPTIYVISLSSFSLPHIFYPHQFPCWNPASFLASLIFLFLKTLFLFTLNFISSSCLFSFLLAGFPGCLVPGHSTRPHQHGRSLGGEREHGLDPSPQDGRTGGSPSLSFRWARTLKAPKSTTPSFETTLLKVEQALCHHRLCCMIEWIHFDLMVCVPAQLDDYDGQ